MTKTKTSLALATILVAIALPLNLDLAFAQSDPLADFFTNSESDTATTTDSVAAASIEETKTYLADITDLQAVAGEENVHLSWSQVADADSYTVYYGTSSISADGGSYANETVVGDVSEYAIVGLTTDTTYYFAIAAEDSTGNHYGSANYSNEASATPVAIGANMTEETVPVSEEIPAMEDSVTVTETTEELHSAAPTILPKSGPETLLVLLVSAFGVYFYRRRTQKELWKNV